MKHLETTRLIFPDARLEKSNVISYKGPGYKLSIFFDTENNRTSLDKIKYVIKKEKKSVFEKSSSTDELIPTLVYIKGLCLGLLMDYNKSFQEEIC